MSISRWMDKKAVVHIHNGVLLSHSKEYIWISSNEVDETGAYYTEWSKPERKTPNQYTNAYMEFRNLVMMALYARQQKRHRCKEQSFGFCGRREDGMIWEGDTEMCILSHVKQIPSPGLMHETGCSELVYWDGEGGGTGVLHAEYICARGWLMSMFGKNHYNIVK